MMPRIQLAHVMFHLQWLRLRAERALSALRPWRRAPRVIATACWNFPIYSQTFVYQELTQLVRNGCSLRFLYGNLNRADPLPRQFRSVWRARRRLIFEPSVCEHSYAYFQERMPERVDALVNMLAGASGLAADEIRSHYHVRQAFVFARLVEAYRPDYLHSYFFYEGTLFALAASMLLRIPRGVSCYADHMLDDYALKVVALHLRQCRAAVATSARIRSELIAIEPQAADGRILVKPNGINAAAFPAVVDRPDVADGDRISLVSVCRIEPKKGLVHMVDAVARLRDAGVCVEWRHLGGVDDSDSSRACHRELVERIAAHALNDVIHLEGRRSEADINACFAASHVFVAPFVETAAGDKDGVPTALLEGMASGLAVVATDAGSILEVVTDGEDGVIVPQRDPAALAAAIAGLIADPARRRTLGANAARTVRERFDAARSEVAFYERVCEVVRSRARRPIEVTVAAR